MSVSPFHLSPSQHNSYTMCPRRHLAESVMRIRFTNPSASRGKALHDIQEQYLKGTRPLSNTIMDTMWAPARKYLPGYGSAQFPEQTGIDAEADMSTEIGGVRYKMFADAVDYHRGKIWDLKSSSNPKKFGVQDPAQLRNNPQVICYSLSLMQRTGLDKVRVSFVYVKSWNPDGRKQKPFSYEVAAVLSKAQAEDSYEKQLAADVDAMAQSHIQRPLPMDLPGNPNSCHLFPVMGCPFQPLCTDVSDVDRMVARMKQGMKS